MSIMESYLSDKAIIETIKEDGLVDQSILNNIVKFLSSKGIENLTKPDSIRDSIKVGKQYNMTIGNNYVYCDTSKMGIFGYGVQRCSYMATYIVNKTNFTRVHIHYKIKLKTEAEETRYSVGFMSEDGKTFKDGN